MTGASKVVHLEGAAHEGGVVLNLRNGRWYALNATATLLCRELRTGGLETAVRAIGDRYPAVDEHRVRRDAGELLKTLADRDMVVFEPPVITETGAAGPPIVARRGTRRYRLRAGVAVAVAVIMLSLPFRWTLWVASVLRARDVSEATTEEAVAMVAMVATVAERYPCRTACLEQSLAAVLTAALSRRRLRWVMGVAEDPYRFHAWVEACGVPVLPSEEPGFSEYRRVLSR
ncbi:lasso peptide biosynthesis B2 protein [Amycolatopsis sp. MJM2582]|uniref:lasso peptide biosynthesis B2 protein n=1 Tax=Amycolatopsis sp. MJM2582 TaxID=1427749 RepID=UPI00068ABAD7|nr:lasso peptide biosynthesis B2 protein [Amycolatopsis sp. MJM2582]